MSERKAPSRHIPQDQKLLLWVRAGGRCELCNKYLLEDPSTMEPISLGEMAHNVGHKQNAQSPRGLEPLDPSLRNDADNLLLLCADEHDSIDDKVNRSVYTVEYLYELKRAHESRIRYLTGMTDDAETVVLRVIGDIRGGGVELSEQIAARAVLKAGRRFPRFDWNYAGTDFEVDLRGLPGEGTELFWKVGQERIGEQLGRLRDAVARDKIRHLSVFGLARIPLLVAVGEHLDDKVPTDLFQKQRGGDEGWDWDPDASEVSFTYERLRDGSGGRVALLLGLSAALSIPDLPDELDDATVWSIAPETENPSRDILRARQSLDNFARAYHECLGEIEAARPKPEAIELLAAVPTTAAITLGRGLMRAPSPKSESMTALAPESRSCSRWRSTREAHQVLRRVP